MYKAFYGLSRKPFKMTPDPSFLFLTDQHREALAGMTYAILDCKGFIVLSGTAGAGKTTLLSWVMDKLPESQIQSSVILNPTLTRDEFLEAALLDFGITEIPTSKAARIWTLQKFLAQSRADGKISVLVIDEAHKLTPDLLEEIRLLGNFEAADQKLLQVVLIGQSELDEVLARRDLWQFKQRISVRLRLKPLNFGEVKQYVQHRWAVASNGGTAPFTNEALGAIYKWSAGIPRLINSICDNALIFAFADASKRVGAEYIDAAAEDLCLTPAAQSPAETEPRKMPVRSTQPPSAKPAANKPMAAAAAASTPMRPAPPRSGKPTEIPRTLLPADIRRHGSKVDPAEDPRETEGLLRRWGAKLGFAAR